jgi:FtsZ-binding cell division protein ZapB
MRTLPLRLLSPDTDTEPQAGAVPDVAAPESAAPQVGTTTDAAPAAAEAPTLSPAEARALKNEAQNLRKRLREFEEAKAEAERAAMTEAERLKADHTAAQQRIAALEAANQAYLLRDAIEAAVTPATLPQEGGEAKQNELYGIDPKLAARLVDAAALERGDDGTIKPAALRKALAALLREYPSIRPQATDAPSRPPQVGQRAAGAAPVGKVDVASRHIASHYALPPTAAKRS